MTLITHLSTVSSFYKINFKSSLTKPKYEREETVFIFSISNISTIYRTCTGWIFDISNLNISLATTCLASGQKSFTTSFKKVSWAVSLWGSSMVLVGVFSNIDRVICFWGREVFYSDKFTVLKLSRTLSILSGEFSVGNSLYKKLIKMKKSCKNTYKTLIFRCSSAPFIPTLTGLMVIFSFSFSFLFGVFNSIALGGVVGTESYLFTLNNALYAFSTFGWPVGERVFFS